MSFKKSLELEGQGRGIIMGIDTLTSARAILHHTDQKGPNIFHPSVWATEKNRKLEFTYTKDAFNFFNLWGRWVGIGVDT
jgi:hypothetical protein